MGVVRGQGVDPDEDDVRQRADSLLDRLAASRLREVRAVRRNPHEIDGLKLAVDGAGLDRIDLVDVRQEVARRRVVGRVDRNGIGVVVDRHVRMTPGRVEDRGARTAPACK